MNTLVVLLFTLAIATAKLLSDEDKEEIKRIQEECASGTGLEDEDILSIYEDGPTDEPKIKEHLFCFLKKMDVINDDGEIQIEALKEKLTKYLVDKDKAEEIASKCAEEKDSPIETAFALGTCIHSEKTGK